MYYCPICLSLYPEQLIPNVNDPNKDGLDYNQHDCFNVGCLGTLVVVDDEIAPLVQHMNMVGFKTIFTCAGHFDTHTSDTGKFTRGESEAYISCKFNDHDYRIKDIKDIINKHKISAKYHGYNYKLVVKVKYHSLQNNFITLRFHIHIEKSNGEPITDIWSYPLVQRQLFMDMGRYQLNYMLTVHKEGVKLLNELLEFFKHGEKYVEAKQNC